MWDLPRPGLAPVSPALAGGFLTTAPPGKPTSWVSSGLTMGSGCSLMAARWQVFFPSWVPSGLSSSRWRVAIAEDCDILCLLIWQETFHFPQAWGADSEKKSENLTRHVLWFTYRQYLYLTVLIEVLKSNQLVLLPSMYQFHPYHKINAYRIDLIHLNRIMIFKGNITEI